MIEKMVSVKNLKQSDLSTLLDNYFWSHGLDKTKRQLEINCFLKTFINLDNFKRANLDMLETYVQQYPSLRIGLVSAIEIGQQVARSIPKLNGQIVGSEEFGNELVKLMSGLEQEQLWLFTLDTKHQILSNDVLHIGSLRTCPFHLRDILRKALQMNAQSIIIAHNHPSGNETPSQNDVKLSNQLASQVKPFEIVLLDSFVVGSKNYTSLREEDELKMNMNS